MAVKTGIGSGAGANAKDRRSTELLELSPPIDIARFLLETDGLSKAMIGEYLGEGCVPHIFSKCKTDICSATTRT